MNILDIIFAVVVGLLFLRGASRGLLIEVASLAGAVIGFFLAGKYHATLSPFVQKFLSDANLAGVLSYLIIFLAAMILVTLVATGIKSLLALTFANWFDKLAGAVLGLAKGLLVCCVALYVASHFFPKAAFVTESQSAPYLNDFTKQALKYVPKDFNLSKYLPDMPSGADPASKAKSKPGAAL